MILTFAHTKGGVGKSTLSWHIAYELTKRKKKVKCIDLDFQQTIYFLNQIRIQSGLRGIEVDQPQSVNELLSSLENHEEDYIIIDIGGFDSDINRKAIEYADKIIVPVSNSITEVLGFKTFEEILSDLLVSNINVVLNNIHPCTKNFDEITRALQQNPNTKMLKTIIRTRKVYRESLGEGKSISDINDKKANEEIKGLCNELISD